MAVRQFTASSSDNLRTAIGALDSMTHGAFVAILKRSSFSALSTIISLNDSSDNVEAQLFFNDDSDSIALYNGDVLRGSGAFVEANWYLIVVRTGSGDVNARGSAYNFNDDAWTHGDLGSLGDWTAPTGGDTDMSFNGTGEFFDGLMAARAVWSNSLGPNDDWTADTSGDSAIEAAGLETAYANWIDASPDAAWRFNQDSTGTAVVDDTGSGADQASITGTTVVNGDDPPGFDFSLSAGTAVGLAAETDTAQPVTSAKTKALGQPSETDLAQPVTAAKAYALGQAGSTETAQPITALKTYSIGQATETDTAFGVTAADVTVIGQATETDQALPATVRKTVALGLATETDTALALVTGEPTPPIVLPPYRESAVPDYQEAAVPAYRERSVPAYQESAT